MLKSKIRKLYHCNHTSIFFTEPSYSNKFVFSSLKVSDRYFHKILKSILLTFKFFHKLVSFKRQYLKPIFDLFFSLSGIGQLYRWSGNLTLSVI